VYYHGLGSRDKLSVYVLPKKLRAVLLFFLGRKYTDLNVVLICVCVCVCVCVRERERERERER
jgi:hypothetical protein